jgi:predicted AAA+ superfamily ATPase
VPTLSEDPTFRAQWFDGYVQTYLERDLRTLSATDNLLEFRRLMQMGAVHNGTVINMASIANDAGLSPATTRRYLNLLETSFQVVRLPAYAVNRSKRLIKAPKLFWTDTGLGAHLAGLFSEDDLVRSREWGRWVENWVGLHLLVYTGLRSPRPALSHWRTSHGHEVDFVLEVGRRVLPIEVKTTSRPSGRDLQGLHTFLDTYPEVPFGILACQCDTPRVLSSRLLALPISDLLLS